MSLKVSVLSGGLLATGLAASALLVPAPASAYDPDYGGTGTTKIGTVFPGANSTGTPGIWYGSHQCSGPYDEEYGETELVNEHYNNSIESVRDFNYCDTKLYADDGFDSVTWGFYDATGSGMNVEGTLKNNAGSIKWS